MGSFVGGTFRWNVPTTVHPRACDGARGSTYTPRQWWVHANYRTRRNTIEYDIALIRLTRPSSGVSIAARYGSMALRASNALPRIFNAGIYGYPGSAGNPIVSASQGAQRQGLELWGDHGQLINAGQNDDTRHHPTGRGQLTTRTIDVTGGQSGGPCFVVIGSVHTLVGTVRGSFDGRRQRWNDCVALTSDKIADILTVQRSA